MPAHLRKTATSKQLIVDGRPFLILGGELQNSSMSSAEHMKPIWPWLKSRNYNTVLGSVTWEQIEPVEGQFDFSEFDQILKDARSHDLRLVVLWFGSYKNGMSNYVPPWVKIDDKRFPRMEIRQAGGRSQITEILSLFGTDAHNADAKAAVAFMRHLREVDEDEGTVIMLQVENEVGLLGDSRDGSHLANKMFDAPVPAGLLEVLSENWHSLNNTFRSNFGHIDLRVKGPRSWAETFGDSPLTDELFMAYHYALYVEHVAAAMREVYSIPMYANFWQNYHGVDKDSNVPVVVGGGGAPGDYPSGGGIVNVLDIWQLFAPSLDFFSPDVYLNNYANICRTYRHRQQPLFIPEQRRDEYGARRAWEALGTYVALGVCPFAVDTMDEDPYEKHWGLLAQVSIHVLEAQAQEKAIFGFFFDEIFPDGRDPSSEQEVVFGDWMLTIQRSFVLGTPSAGSGLVIHKGGDRFLLVGWGFQIIFKSTNPRAYYTGLLQFDEKIVVNRETGELKTLRKLNGDETRSGQFAIMPSADPDYGDFPIAITIPAKTGIAEVRPYALIRE